VQNYQLKRMLTDLKMATDFPTKGEDKKISLRNSNYPQFDYDFALSVKENNNEVWRTGGNIRGNEAFEFWTKARDGVETQGTLDWIKEREAWAARHFEDGKQFKDGDLEPNKSNIAGVVAQMKWGMIGTLGERGMKDVVLELVKKLEGKKDDERGLSDLSEKVQKGLRNKADEHNEEYGDDPTKRTNTRTLAAVFERGVGAYNTNPQSVRPGVTSSDAWAYARVNSFLFVLRNGRFQGGKHDTDLLPLGHPLSTKERDMENITERHIQNVEETDEAYIITFAKPMAEAEVDEDMEARPYHYDDEEKGKDKDEMRLDRLDMTKRGHYFDSDQRVIDEENRTVRIGVSSEEPVERDFGMEVIDHSRQSMNLDFINSGRAPLLVGHSLDDQVGVVERVELDEDARRLRAVVRFGKSQRASEMFDDVRDGIRTNISVGYRIDGRIERDEDADDIVRVRTTPMEISIVSVPADQSNLVGVGRSVSEPLQPSDKEIRMSENTETQGIDLDAVKDEAVRAARKNDSEILSIAAKHNKRDLGEQAIRDGVGVDVFRGQILDAIGDEKPLDTPLAVVDAPVKEKRSYSLGRMIQAQVTGDFRNAGFEREMNDEITRKVGRQGEGFYVPDFVWGQRGALSTAATGGSGAEVVFDDFVPTEHRGDMFIEALRNKLVLGDLGATFMSGLTGRIKMPKLATGAAAGFVEELADVGDGAGTDGALTLQPRTMGAFVEVSRLLMMESVPSIEQIIRDDLLRSAADKTEHFAIQGSGSSGQPTGILNTSGINDLDISADTDVAALTWQDIVDLVKLVEEDNGIVNDAAAGFLSNPKVKSKLATTVKVGSTDSVMLLNDPWNNLYGYPTGFTSNVPSNLNPGDGGTDASALIFGDFSQLIIGQFGAPSIMVNPFSGDKSGTVRLTLLAEMDVGVRNAVSFAVTNEVSTA
jgi:HK97 family phage major capsid protein/HK97 family phage prohead protease